MMLRSLIAAATLALAGAAHAAAFLLTYTTQADVFTPALSFSGRFTTGDAQFGGLAVADLSGTRAGDAVTGFDPYDLNGSQTFYPAGQGYFDGLGLAYHIGDTSFTVRFDGSRYYELRQLVDADENPIGNATSAVIQSLTVTPATTAVPEPATWATMLVGLALVGTAMRRRMAAAGTAQPG